MSENIEMDWEDYVRGEVNSLLDLYIPYADTGNVGIKYDYAVTATDEGGAPVEFDRDTITGVTIQLVFPFPDGISIVKDEEPSEE